MPTMTIPSHTMRRLRREALEISRRRAALASTVVIAKKPSQQQPSKLYSPLLRSNPAASTPPRAHDGDGARRSESARPEPSASARSHGAAAAAAAVMTKCCIGKGAQVRVRTRVGTVCTGQALVLWLRAVVEAAADEDGFLRVAYTYSDGKLPRIARVAPRDVKLHVPPPAEAHGAAAPAGSSTVTVDHSVLPTSSQQRKAAAPRSTVAGKKLPKKLEKEMRSWCKAITGC